MPQILETINRLNKEIFDFNRRVNFYPYQYRQESNWYVIPRYILDVDPPLALNY